jgi:hypothetical protein
VALTTQIRSAWSGNSTFPAEHGFPPIWAPGERQSLQICGTQSTTGSQPTVLKSKDKANLGLDSVHTESVSGESDMHFHPPEGSGRSKPPLCGIGTLNDAPVKGSGIL